MDNRYFFQRRGEIIALIPERRRRILEIGCGAGIFAASIEGAEEIWGIEPTAHAAEQAAGRLFKVICAPFDIAKSKLSEQYFDIIICNDVIEHMHDHDLFFEEIKKFISPGGVLIGSIPNVRYYNNLYNILFHKEWSYADSGILDKSHLRFFTEISLLKCLSAHQFDIERFYGINSVIHVTKSIRENFVSAIVSLLIIISFGFNNDIQYLQFAFRVRPSDLN
ncbi:MAG TPA: class I SAM-dependent methyltransferase [Methylosinus sp.]|jgi:2-polyprenyl-3-methyl-5-hydroxy-6-metoxy-1,4-benzoquinol methylase|uniref:class I SAM-dependent methyltransferase n=1 Tax=Methylosinus sp. TaxID=427 RepID=UPI002F9338D0